MNKLDSIEIKRRTVFLHYSMGIGIIILTIFGIMDYLNGNNLIYVPIFLIEFLVIVSYIHFILTKKYSIIAYSTLLLSGSLFLYLLFMGGVNNTGHLWSYIFPLTAFFLLGYKKGSIALLIFLVIVFFGFARDEIFNIVIYSFDFKLRFISVLLVVSIITFMFEYRRAVTQKSLIQEIIEKEKIQAELLQSEKMVAVGQLAGGVAHEINNPMTVILGYAQLIVRDIKKDDLLYEPLKSIEREAIRCRKLIGDLLTFVRTSKTTKESVDINVTIDETLSLIEAQTKVRNIKLIKEYGTDLPQITVNKNQIQQVIVNLCNNAIDAMPEGGTITITTKKSGRRKTGDGRRKNRTAFYRLPFTIYHFFRVY